MQVPRTEDLAEYHEILRDNVEEAQALLADLLISVTTFLSRPRGPFRGSPNCVIRSCSKKRTQTATIRVWVPGCATGEEAYSLAILLLEEAGAP